MQTTMETKLTCPVAAEDAPATAPAEPSALKIIGLGGAGVNLVEELCRNGWDSAACAVVSADRETLAKSSAAEKIHLEPGSVTGATGRGTGRGNRSFEHVWPKLKTVCSGAQTVLIVAGLGGRTGTSLSLAAARAAKQSGALTLAFVTLPFDCEGSLRQHHAQTGLAQLRAAADIVFCLPNQKTLSLIREETNLLDTYKIANQLLGDCLRGVCLALTTTRAAMGLPFCDLCALIQEHHGVAAFATSVAAGPNRAVEAVEKLLKHPLVEEGRLLPQAGVILVSLVGGPDLTLAEVNRLMAQVQKHSEGVPVIMGAGIQHVVKEKLFVVLVLTDAAQKVKPEARHDGTAQPVPAAVSPGGASDLEKQFLGNEPASRASSRFIPPPPALTPEQREHLIAQHAETVARQRKGGPRLRQPQLPLEIVSKGRFEKSQPTIYKGEDLDVPTYIRRGVVLN